MSRGTPASVHSSFPQIAVWKRKRKINLHKHNYDWQEIFKDGRQVYYLSYAYKGRGYIYISFTHKTIQQHMKFPSSYSLLELHGLTRDADYKATQVGRNDICFSDTCNSHRSSSTSPAWMPWLLRWSESSIPIWDSCRLLPGRKLFYQLYY